MASRAARLLAPLALAALLGACERENRRFAEPAWTAGIAQAERLGHPSPVLYQDNAWAVSQGSRLFEQMNCNGCHANGGGGMGPALMDAKWRYGSEPQQVYLTIVQGRPNGMPSFGGKLTEAQAWQLVAYVRSLSGLLRLDVEPGREDHMSAHAPPAMLEHHHGKPKTVHEEAASPR